MTWLKEGEASGTSFTDPGNPTYRIQADGRESQQSTCKHKVTAIMHQQHFKLHKEIQSTRIQQKETVNKVTKSINSNLKARNMNTHH